MSGNYLHTMLDKLTGAYCRDDIKRIKKGLESETHIGKLYSLLAEGLENVEDITETLRTWDSVQNAEGIVLDRYGNNYGVKREGTDDDFYRLMIMVKMMAQLSGGDINTVLNAAATLFDVDDIYVRLNEIFPAKVWLRVNGSFITDETRKRAVLIAKVMKRILAAGIGLIVLLESNGEVKGKYYVGALQDVLLDSTARHPAVLSAGTAVGILPVAVSTVFIDIMIGMREEVSQDGK